MCEQEALQIQIGETNTENYSNSVEERKGVRYLTRAT